MQQWLFEQAQTASPFVAVFCLMMLSVSAFISKKLWDRHIRDGEIILSITKSQTEANNAVALAIERSAKTTSIAIEKLGSRLQTNRRRK